MRYNPLFRWAAFVALGLALPALSASPGPVTFDARLAPGERVVVEGSVVTLGSSVFLASGSELVVRASESVVFSPGIDVSSGRLDASISGGSLAKSSGLPVVASFEASIRRAPDGIVLRYALPEAGRLKIRVMDPNGRSVFSKTLTRSGGRHDETLAFSNRRSGLYLARMEFSGKVITQRVFLGSR